MHGGHTRVARWGILGVVCLVFALWLTASQLGAQQAILEGWFHIIWYDGPPGSGIKGEIYVLIDDQGQEYRLQLDLKLTEPFGGVLALNRKRVKLVVEQAPGSLGQQEPVRVLSIQLGAGAMAGVEPVAGPQPWVNLLCKFGDVSAEPQPLSYFTGLMSNTYPGLDHYWREVSFNNINIVGSDSQPWRVLPQPRSYYVYDKNGDGDTNDPGEADLTPLFNDCVSIHDASVYFPNFVGINLMFNDLLDCCAWGGSRTATLDNVTKTYRVTWEPPWGYGNQGVMAHEMGHGWGWPHSSGAYGATYDSRWDVMSDIWNTCPPTDPTYGCVGQGTISYHKDLGAWVPSARKFVPTLNTVTTIEIDRLNQPGSSTNYLMARIPIIGSSQFYTVEARRFIGYDNKVPAEAIVIHHVDSTRASDAWVVDADGNLNGVCLIPDEDANCDPDDAGAQWTPGETYTDAANAIQIRVNSITATGFSVTITYGNPPSCTNTGAVFRIERTTGNACTDGSWNSGGADVAEYILASEPLEPGDVVEVDLQNPTNYRKARGAYSTLVAGVISTAPGLVLGLKLSAGPNPFTPSLKGRGDSPLALGEGPGERSALLLSEITVSGLAEQAQSARPLLALLGRVPVKVTTENGPIRPGDLLTSSSKPGYAMRCADVAQCEGAIIGKALESLDEGEGVILMLVMR